MASDDKQPGTNLASNSVILAALVAAGTAYFANHEAPLQGSRPAMVEPQIHAMAGTQDIDARLWQDPFAAVAKSRDNLDRSEDEQQCREIPLLDRHCKSPLTGGDEKTLVLGVGVSGASYSEDGESRRRTRYAVVAGLHKAGFIPADAEHIDYFRLPPQLPALPARLDRPLPFIAYERFLPANSRAAIRTVLVLWLDETDVLGNRPLRNIARLANFLRKADRGGTANAQFRILGPNTSDILHAMEVEASLGAGPLTGRDATDCAAKKEEQERWPELKGVRFYTYGASAEDQKLLEGLSRSCTSVHDYFANLGLNLQRTIATDDVLARGIVGELDRRGIKPGPGSMDHLALISEWDTFYGQTLPKTMERCFEDPDKCSPKENGSHPWVHRLTYLRGLDGQLPGAKGSEDRKAGKRAGEADKQASVTDSFKTQSDAKDADRPYEQAQFDYLRRLAAHLRKIDEDLRQSGPGRIRAIGVLGSDVFDKLLVLRALRPEFPEALFFTTDFDATLIMGSELSWTRNLIISSSFGPALRDEIQDEIPPFRSSYQTSAFLATNLAIGDPNDGWNPCSADAQLDKLDRWLSQPRIFEIERTSAVLPFPGDNVAARNTGQPLKGCPHVLPNVASNAFLKTGRSVSSGDGDPSPSAIPAPDRPQAECEKELLLCNGIQPEVDASFPRFEPQSVFGFELKGETVFAAVLAVAALLVLSALRIRRVRERAGVEVSLVGLTIGAGATACYNWERFAAWLTEGGNGEPIALMQGVSVWPTVLLRALSVVLSGYLLWRAWQKLNKNLYEIAREMNLPMPNLAIAAEGEADKRHSLRKQLLRMFSCSLRERQPDMSKPYNVKTAWSEYIYQGRGLARLLRVAAYVAIMWIVARFVVSPLLGFPISPARGSLSLFGYTFTTISAYKFMTMADVFCTQAVMFLVFDATLLCLRFVKELCRSSTEWPAETKAQFECRLGLEHQFVDQSIDLDFVAKRTRCISTLVYYPFFLIALLLVSRSTVFANYPPCLAILVLQGISLTIVFGCAIALCLAAQALRSAAKQKLTDGVICAQSACAKESDDGGRRARQLEALLVRVDGLREGAFSPLSQQPLVRALLLPLSGFGGTTLLENGMLPGL